MRLEIKRISLLINNNEDFFKKIIIDLFLLKYIKNNINKILINKYKDQRHIKIQKKNWFKKIIIKFKINNSFNNLKTI